MKAYIAVGWDGRPNLWTVSPVRKETMQRATETMMGANDYHALESLRARWSYCYRRGCRIVRATVTVEATK